MISWIDTFYGIVGIIVGIAISSKFYSGKITDLQNQVNDLTLKMSQRCQGCDYHRRMIAAEDQLKDEREKAHNLYRSNIALRRDNKNLYRKVWRDA